MGKLDNSTIYWSSGITKINESGKAQARFILVTNKYLC